MSKCELPDRQTLENIARRYRVDGYELDDLTQECYLALLEAQRDRGEWTLRDAELHLRRLKGKECRINPRGRQVRVPCLEWAQEELCDDNSLLRSECDIEALTLLIAVQSLCRNTRDERLLSWLLEGATYRQICGECRCNYGAARERVREFRTYLRSEVDV